MSAPAPFTLPAEHPVPPVTDFKDARADPPPCPAGSRYPVC
jgi:hypothetical protein